MLRRLQLIYTAMALASLPLQAYAASAEPPTSERARAGEILDGDTFVLEDGREVRLAGIDAAKAVTPSAMEDPPPVVLRAVRVLERLVAGRDLELVFAGTRRDRHRRLLAHVYVAHGPEVAAAPVWVQGALLEQGLARVATTLDVRAWAGEMLLREAEARSRRRGIWALEFYRVLSSEEAELRTGSFQLVEGRVKVAAIVGSRAFLNFGDDWQSDFTVALDAAVRRRFRESGFVVEAFEGKLVRVRGWIESYNGPMIKVTHPEQVEVLEE